MRISGILHQRLEERLAKRRARLAELRQTMEDERSKAVEDDPDALKALSRAQVDFLTIWITIVTVLHLFFGRGGRVGGEAELELRCYV